MLIECGVIEVISIYHGITQGYGEEDLKDKQWIKVISQVRLNPHWVW